MAGGLCFFCWLKFWHALLLVYQSIILSLSNDTEVREPGHIIFPLTGKSLQVLTPPPPYHNVGFITTFVPQIKSSGVIVIVNYMTCDLLHVRMEALCLPPGISWLNTNLATSV